MSYEASQDMERRRVLTAVGKAANTLLAEAVADSRQEAVEMACRAVAGAEFNDLAARYYGDA